jgi:hypothetical protein
MNTEDYNNELNTIKYISQENGHPEMIDTTMRRRKKITNCQTYHINITITKHLI